MTVNRPTPAEAVGRLVEAALAVGGDTDLGPYWLLAQGLRRKLTRHERQGLAWATLMACDDEEAVGIAAAVLGPTSGAGWPLPPFDGLLEEAEFWADMADPDELRAYATVCLDRLPEAQRRAILDRHVRRAAA